jgi:hypothetical protein
MAHEIGHWLGLLHTFSGCDDNDFGDDIESTVAETSNPLLDPLVAKGGVIGDLEIETKSKFVGCDAYPLFLKLMPFNRNSCNQKYDAAAILNIMEYGECMKRFNADQMSVMLDVWKRRRELQRLGQRCSGP